ncbi:MAG: LysR family transcriptional regulator [Pseudomonadota bacterium]
MDVDLKRADWSLIQSFLAVADAGSLSGAARDLRTSQPTVGRQIKALEDQLDATLFHRRARGFVLTDVGASLIQPAQKIRDAIGEIELIAAGRSATLAGPVRITASVMTAQYHLPDIIATIRQAEPDIEIELVPSDDSRNLLYREADIAVRMYRPTQLELVTQFIGEFGTAVCAARSYLDRKGPLKGVEDFPNHDFVGYDTRTLIIDGFRDLGFDVDRDFFAVRCDEFSTYWALIRAGCGIGFMQRSIVAGAPEVEEIELGFDMPRLPVWLTAHEAMRRTPRVRRVWELLTEGLKPLVS